MNAVLRAVITAGGTREPLDDVRVLTNLSSGAFGLGLARALRNRGVHVTLIAGPTLTGQPSKLPRGVRVLPFETHAQLAAQLDLSLKDQPDLVFMAAAISDYGPDRAPGKIRSDAETLTLQLARLPKLLPTLRPRLKDAVLVGFKLLSGVSPAELHAVARAQLRKAQLDLCVANMAEVLGADAHPASLVTKNTLQDVTGDKAQVARVVADVALDLLARKRPGRARPTPDTWPFGPGVGQPAPDALHDWLPQHRQLAILPALLCAPHGALPQPATPGEPPSEHALFLAASEAAARGWRGGPLCLVAGPSTVMLLDPDASEQLGPAFTQALRALHAEYAVPAGATTHPLLEGGRLVGAEVRVPAGAVSANSPAGTALHIHPGRRRHCAGDTAFYALDLRGDLAILPHSDGPFLARRGWLRVHQTEHYAWWQGPSRRQDLRPAASACLFDPGRRMVLLGERLSGAGKGLLAFPGGHCEPGEPAIAAALRELHEETGLNLPSKQPLRTQRVQVGLTEGGEQAYEITCAIWHVPAPQAPRATPELNAKWIPLAAALTHPALAVGTRRVLRGL